MNKLMALIWSILLSGASFGLDLTAINNNLTSKQQKIEFYFNNQVEKPRVFAINKDLIVDFQNTINRTNKNKYIFNMGYIRELSLASSNSRVRVVINLGASYKYNLTKRGSKIIFSFSPTNLETNTISLTKVGVARSNGSNLKVNKIEKINFIREDDGSGVVEVDYTGNNQINYKPERVAEGLLLKLRSTGYLSSLIKRLDVSQFGTPIKYIDTTGAGNSLTIKIITRDSWDYASYNLEHKLIINIRDAKQASKLPLLNANNKSDLVSFNFQNIEVRALLQLLAEFSGYNILVSDSVNGTMSLKLHNVPWEQALGIILDARGLSMQKDGNIIRIAPNEELVKLSKQKKMSETVMAANEPIETATIRLKYAQANSVQAMLLQRGGGAALASKIGSPDEEGSLISSRGSVLVDTRTNTLIINDTPTHLNEIKTLIDKIDIPVKQVLIEARIVEATSNFEQALGTRLLLAGVTGSTTWANTLENGVTINQTGINSVSANPTGFVNQNFGVSGGASLATIFAPNSDTLIGLEIDAMEQQSQGKTISSPKIMTANYQTANIQQGVQIPYQQASSAGNTNVAFVNATLSLKVTPQITDDGYILLTVSIQKDSPNTKLQVQGTPSIDTNSINTMVRVKDGSTILVGGIYIDDQQKVSQQIPLLGDIPVLGWLFKATAVRNSKKELLIFITPRVISSSLD